MRVARAQFDAGDERRSRARPHGSTPTRLLVKIAVMPETENWDDSSRLAVLQTIRILVGKLGQDGIEPRIRRLGFPGEPELLGRLSAMSLKALLDEVAVKYATRAFDRVDRTDQDAVAAAFKDDYAYFQYHLVEFVTEHMLDLSRAFEGDLQQVLVLAVVGQVALHSALRKAQGVPNVAMTIAASRIADVTGIPRQTVRRKLDALRERGWIEQDSTSGWHLSVKDGAATAAVALAELDGRGIARGARLAAAFALRL